MNTIKILQPSEFKEQFDKYVDLLKYAKIDVIAAAKSDGICKDLLLKLGDDERMINNYCNSVNSKYEVGCLFPKHTFTLFPIFKSDKNETIETDLSNFFYDTFEAQEKYFSCPQMIYLFDKNTWPDFDLLENILSSELTKRTQLSSAIEITLCTNL